MSPPTRTYTNSITSRPWAITMWAPLTFLGVEVNKMSGAADPSTGGGYRRVAGSDAVEMHALDGEAGHDHAPNAEATEGELSGIYFGILNIYATIPQFIGSFISGIVFALLDPGKSPELTEGETKTSDGPNAIAVCLFIGAVSTILAAVMTHRLKHL
jgi:solute carrier family 45, member 1/2/4